MGDVGSTYKYCELRRLWFFTCSCKIPAVGVGVGVFTTFFFWSIDPKWKWSCESVIVKVILYYCDSKTIHQVWSYSPYAWYISWDCIVGSQISERKCARRVRLMWITIICIYHGIFPCYICQPMHIPDSRGLRGVRKKGNQTTVQQFDGLDLISLLLFLVI